MLQSSRRGRRAFAHLGSRRCSRADGPGSGSALMKLTTLGDSGLSVSRVGLGLAALGRPGYINLGHSVDLLGDLGVETMEARAFDVLDAAWSLGVRYFDAAR